MDATRGEASAHSLNFRKIWDPDPTPTSLAEARQRLGRLTASADLADSSGCRFRKPGEVMGTCPCTAMPGRPR